MEVDKQDTLLILVLRTTMIRGNLKVNSMTRWDLAPSTRAADTALPQPTRDLQAKVCSIKMVVPMEVVDPREDSSTTMTWEFLKGSHWETPTTLANILMADKSAEEDLTSMEVVASLLGISINKIDFKDHQETSTEVVPTSLDRPEAHKRWDNLSREKVTEISLLGTEVATEAMFSRENLTLEDLTSRLMRDHNSARVRTSASTTRRTSLRTCLIRSRWTPTTQATPRLWTCDHPRMIHYPSMETHVTLTTECIPKNNYIL